MCSAQHDLRQSRDWRVCSMDDGYSREMCERFYISYRFEAKKDNWQFEGKYGNYCDNVITLHFDLAWVSHIFFRLLLNLICNLIHS